MIPAQRAPRTVAVLDVPEQPTAVLLDRAERIKTAVALAHVKWLRADCAERQQVVDDLADALHAATASADLEACRRMAVAVLHRLEGGR